jgi:hypothetical protein
MVSELKKQTTGSNSMSNIRPNYRTHIQAEAKASAVFTFGRGTNEKIGTAIDQAVAAIGASANPRQDLPAVLSSFGSSLSSIEGFDAVRVKRYQGELASVVRTGSVNAIQTATQVSRQYGANPVFEPATA